uniref:CSON013292 protein n=1 Tax=Culicoides sonorensis TaxID=179676 RepID=A0A336KRD6_CULSO
MEFSANNYCRLCLKTSKECDLMKRHEINAAIIRVIFKVFEINLERCEDVSSNICSSCCDIIQNISEYIDIVTKNQEILKSTRITIEPELQSFIKVEEISIKTEIVDETDNCDTFQPSFQPPTIPNSFLCNICSQIFESQSAVTSHIESVHIPSHECEICNKRFNTSLGLINHKNKLHIDNPRDLSAYTFCELCSDKPYFINWDEMNQHYLQLHETRGYATCCNKRYITKSLFLEHLKFHENPVEFMCTICKKYLANSRKLKKHMLRHRPDDAKEFQCHHCDKRYHHKAELKFHIKSAHLKDDQKKNCEYCNKTYSSHVSLSYHIRRMHMDQPLEICDQCGYATKSKYDLKKHVVAIHSIIIKEKCEICGLEVKYLKKHMRVHAEAPSLDFKCDICHVRFSHSHKLKRHMLVHSEEKPFVCTTCGKSFKRKINLDDHMSQHTQIPGHFCNYCDRTFNNSGNKVKHMKQMHPEEYEKNRKRIMR